MFAALQCQIISWFYLSLSTKKKKLSCWDNMYLMSLRLSKCCSLSILHSMGTIFLYLLSQERQNIIGCTIRAFSTISLLGASYFKLHYCMPPTCSCLLSIGKDRFFFGEYCHEWSLSDKNCSSQMWPKKEESPLLVFKLCTEACDQSNPHRCQLMSVSFTRFSCILSQK